MSVAAQSVRLSLGLCNVSPSEWLELSPWLESGLFLQRYVQSFSCKRMRAPCKVNGSIWTIRNFCFLLKASQASCHLFPMHIFLSLQGIPLEFQSMLPVSDTSPRIHCSVCVWLQNCAFLPQPFASFYVFSLG